MRVGIVGGQKKKTEAHLFKSLEVIGIEVAWHVEAMTNKEFSKDCDAIVSMVDYVGHGLFAKAKAFAKANNIPFRQITYNWSKSRPTFLELKEKANMNKIIPPNSDWINAADLAKIVGYSVPTIKGCAERGEIACYNHTVGSRNFIYYSKKECVEFFANRRNSENQPKQTESSISVFEFPDRSTKNETSNLSAKDNGQLIVCKIIHGKYHPIIDIKSLDELNDAIGLYGGNVNAEGEYAVISIVKRVNAKISLTIEEV